MAAQLKAGDVLALAGELGAGKTQFVKGVAAGLGHGDSVTSPTFTLIHEYIGGRLALYHFDFYRADEANEIAGIGFDDYLADEAVLAIEWADKFPELLPSDARWFRFRILENGTREIVVS